MGKGIKDDNVSLNVKVGTSEAQEAIRKLTESNRDLEKVSKSASLEMAKLEAQGKKNTKEYQVLEKVIEMNKNAIKENKEEIQKKTEALDLNAKTMKQLRKDAKDLKIQLDSTSKAADPETYAKLEKELDDVTGRIKELRTGTQTLQQRLTSIPGPAGQVAQGFYGIGTAMKALLANPIMAILAAVVAIFVALYKAISTSEEATNKLNKILAPLGAMFDAILNVVQELVISILNFVEVVVNGFAKVLEKIPAVGKHFKQLNDYNREAIKLEEAKQVLTKREREEQELTAEREYQIAKLRTEAKQKDIFSADERMKKIKEAFKLEKQIAVDQHKIAIERLRIAKEEAKRAGNTAETNNKLSELKAQTWAAEKQYEDRTRELTEQLNTLKAEFAAEEKAKTEERINREMAAVDTIINNERRALMQQRLDKEITQEEYFKRLEQLELDALNRRLAIKGLEQEKIAEINEALLAKRLELQTAEEERVKSENEDKRKKEQEEKLNAMDEDFANEQMKVLEQFLAKQLSEEEMNAQLLAIEQAYQDRKIEMAEDSEKQRTALALKQAQARVKDQIKIEAQEKALMQKRAHTFMDFGGQVGTILGDMLTNSEVSIADAMGDILLLTLDSLRQMALIYVAQTTMRNVSQYGFLGLVKAAGEIALINGAFAAIKGVIKRPSKKNSDGDDNGGDGNTPGSIVVNQRARGKYDVIGADDGLLYSGVPYIGSPESGIVRGPALISERGDEMIISSPDMQLLRNHMIYPQFVAAMGDIRGGRVTQFAYGKYDSIDTQGGSYNELGVILARLSGCLEYLERNGIAAYVGLDQMDAQRKLRDKSRSLGSLK